MMLIAMPSGVREDISAVAAGLPWIWSITQSVSMRYFIK
jgi:hypothetical protein